MRRNSSTNFSLNAKVTDMANSIIQELEKARATRKLPDFNPGDTVVVQVKVKEGDRERAQAYEGVERTFQTHSPSISEVEVKRRGSVRRAKLYYLRDLKGKAARMKDTVKAQ